MEGDFIYSVELNTTDFYSVINALRDKCGCNDCERIANQFITYRKRVGIQG